jgi:hypothetical protein
MMSLKLQTIILYHGVGADSLSLINHGYNVFQAELSSLTITDENFTANDVHRITGDDITSESFKFDDDYTSFANFAESDASNVYNEFNLNEGNGAYGSLSLNRLRAQTTVTTTQYYIFTVRLRDPHAKLEKGEYREMKWTTQFLDHLVVLPRNYTTGDDLEGYKYFWTKFGTHLFRSVELGGMVSGTVISDKCYVTGEFTDTSHYKTCLNAQWQGTPLTECEGFDTDFAMKRITARGGDLTTFSSVVDSFNVDQDKISKFRNWTDSLSLDNYHVVGGQIQGIWYGLRQSILIGGHTLNDFSSAALSDDEWMAIGVAMESAYDDYAEQLTAVENSVECTDDQIQCHRGFLLTEDCRCTDCKDAAWCCGYAITSTTDSGSADWSIGLRVSSVFMFVLAVFVLTM